MATAQPTLQDVQRANDELHPEIGLEPDDGTDDAGAGGTAIQPRNNQETQDALRDLHAGMEEEIQKRKDANESIAALREKAVTLGISKKAQSAVEAFMRLNESDQEYFDEAVSIYRAALGKPMQGSLALR